MGIAVKKKNIRYNILIIVFAVLFVGSAGAMLRSAWQYHQSSSLYRDLANRVVQENTAYTEQPSDQKKGRNGKPDRESAPIRVDFETLTGQYPQIAGWLYCSGTNINYPVMQGEDNSYYLHHAPDGAYQFSGSLFLSCNNTMPFADDNTIIYGHNMKNGSMFAGLKNYGKKNYYEAHPYIYLDQEDGTHCYQIFSCHEADVTDVTYTIGYHSDDTYAAFLDELTASSLYDTGVSVGTDDSVLTLSTCTNKGAKRFVLHAKKLY